MLGKLILKEGREKSILNRHPWVFSGAVQSLEAKENGEIISVFDSKKNLLGYGFYDADSQIIVRIFHFTSELHTSFNKDFWKNKIHTAFDWRKEAIVTNDTNSYRLLYAEGDFLPGIIADVYGNQLICQMVIPGTLLLRDMFFEIFNELGFAFVYEKETGFGSIPETSIQILENGLTFKVDPAKGQKTGFFLDQRENRNHVRAHAKDKKVLNAFSFTGGFSVYAFSGGAKSVVSVDISAPAIENCIENIKLNFGAAVDHQAITADCFEYLRTMPNDFDLIILDPPAFVKHKNALDKGARGYKDINLQAFSKIKSGGLLYTFTCSQHVSMDLFRKIVFGAAADAKREIQVIGQMHQSADHPVSIYHPEGEYLKGLICRVL